MRWDNQLINPSELIQCLQYSKAGILLEDAEGTIVWANQAYKDITGTDIENYIGNSALELVTNSGEVLFDTNYSTMYEEIINSKKEITTVVKYRTKDYVITTGTPVFDQKQDISYIIFTVMNYNQVVYTQQQLSEAYAKIAALENYSDENRIFHTMEHNLICEDAKMREIYLSAFHISSMPISVILMGESGTGKDVLANYIHQQSDRRDKPFIHVNLGAIPEPLFESELFGYEPGAFTGALKSGKDGLIQLSDGGTLFLDEIGELPLDMQSKLLQVIQDHTVRKIGSNVQKPVDLRIISATNRDLHKMVEEGTFRLDLFYRLDVIEFNIPALRQRRDDIFPLIMLFLKANNQKWGTKKIFSQETITALSEYDWPGNIRQLRHMIERLVVSSSNDVITYSDLPAEITKNNANQTQHSSDTPKSLKEELSRLESQMIRDALLKSSNAKQAAGLLGIDDSTLSKKRRKYGL